MECSPAKPLTLALPYSNKEGCRTILPPRTEIAHPPAKKAGVGGKASTMKLRKQSGVVLTLAMFIAVVLSGGTAQAQAYRVIHNFQGTSDGFGPVGVPAIAKNGDLYGVTDGGGTSDWGTVFKLTAPLTRGGRWKKAVLYNFPGGQGGGQPISLVLGTEGNLYGDDGETIFELSPPSSRHRAWNYTALYTLNQQNDGAGIEGLTLDTEGNLYGATQLGGDMNCSCGAVFELEQPAQKGGQWIFIVLYTFTGPDGAEPFAGVTFDQNGDLYGIGGHFNESDSGPVDDEFCQSHSEHLRRQCEQQDRQREARYVLAEFANLVQRHDQRLTRNSWLLFSTLLGVVTVTKPVVAPLGTFATR